MWLLDCKTLELKLYFDNNIPLYAILSHTWGENEVSFQQISGPREQIQSYAGFTKIQKCCAQAVTDGFEHVWIDTCCIDKTNSTELSEAINSMFNWYRDATECYIYLADVTGVHDLDKSRWFTRGWTLQELIAPDSAIFFNKEWSDFGTKSSLAENIASITNIPVQVLLHQRGPQCSVAQVMSWAAKRQTTRVEDLGYCLLGLFGVNMPMIYGEGRKAFLRLQHEIIKGSTDQSLFAWTKSQDVWILRCFSSSAFAESPADFFGCGTIVRTTGQECEFFLTNKGLRIQLVVSHSVPHSDESFTGYLNCTTLADGPGHRLGIHLRKISHDQYVRVGLWSIERSPLPLGDDSDAGEMTTIYIADPETSFVGISSWTGNLRARSVTFTPSYNQCRDYGFLRVDMAEYPLSIQRQNEEQNRYCEMHLWQHTHPFAGGVSAFKFQHGGNPNLQFIVAFGTTNDCRVWSDIELQIGGNEGLQRVARSYCDNGLQHVNERYARRFCARYNARDRITVLLEKEPTRLFVNVALKKVLLSGQVCYKVDITIT
jgi:hypothetical protein